MTLWSRYVKNFDSVRVILVSWWYCDDQNKLILWMYKLGTGVKLQMIRYFPLDILDSLGPGFQLIESLVSWKNSIMLTLSIMFGEALWGIEGANFQKYSSVIRRGTWGVLNTATPQKNLTNTASPQEKSTKHRHRNNYFQLHNFNVFIWRNTFIPKQLSTK